MSRRPEAEMNAISNEFDALMKTPEFRAMTQAQKADHMKTSVMTICRWLRDVKPEQWEIWLKEDNKHLASRVIQVDDTLLKQALTGDVAAIKLWYQKKEGWSERQILDNINRTGDAESVSDEDLLKHFSADVLEKALKAKELKVVEPKAENG